jgi:hypothetical protein
MPPLSEIYMFVADCISAHPFISAVFISVFGGVLVSWLLHRLNQSSYATLPEDAPISATIGGIERLLLTFLVIWLPAAVGPLGAAWLGVKAVVGWARMDATEGHAARARSLVTPLLGSAISFLWAIGCGVWARWMANLPKF